MEIFWTIIAGVVVFVLSQLFIEYGLRPIQKYKNLKGRIAYLLTYYADVYFNPITDIKEVRKKRLARAQEASDELRKCAAEVIAFSEEKPRHALFIVNSNLLKDVSQYLIGLSNSMYLTKDENDTSFSHTNWVRELENNIRKILKLYKAPIKG